jgi:hypothetical protein
MTEFELSNTFAAHKLEYPTETCHNLTLLPRVSMSDLPTIIDSLEKHRSTARMKHRLEAYAMLL